MLCSCTEDRTCQECVTYTHTKHEIRRHMTNLRGVLRTEYDPERAKKARGVLKTLELQSFKLETQPVSFIAR